MIYPRTVPLQEVVTFTYRAPVFDLPGGGLRGVNLPPLQEDDLPTETCLGGRLWPPRRVPGATGQNVGYKKIFCVSVNLKSGLSKMIYPRTVPLQEVVTFTYRAPVFDLPGGVERG